MRYFVLFVIPAMAWVGILRYDRVLIGFSDKFLFANLTIIGICSLILFAKYCTNHRSIFTGFAAIFLNFLVVFAISNSKEIHYVNIGILFCLSLIFLSSLNFPKYLSLFLVVFTSTCALFVSLFGEYTSRFGSIGNDTYAAILQTNAFEAFYYLLEFFTWWPVLAAGAVILAYLGTGIFLQKLERLPSPQFLALILIPIACLLLAGATPLIRQSHKQILDLPYSLQAFYSQRALEREVLSRLGHLKEASNNTPLPEFPGNLIVIIGESVSRPHMSLYGYHRTTTPNLDGLASDLIVFDDAVTPYSHTVSALLAAFTPASYAFDQDDPSVFLHYYENNLLIMARKIGLYTAWVSNQIEYGLFENPTTTLAKFADNVSFTSAPVGRFAEIFGRSEHLRTPDTVMIGELENLLEERPRSNLIFLHMNAIHFPYCHHASDQFINELNNETALGRSFFGEAEDYGDLTDCYDAGVRTVDHFVSEVFTVASGVKAPTMVLYFSDHGEAPTLATGHDSARHSHYHNEVPLLVFFNQPGKDFFREEIQAARKNMRKPVLTSNIYESLLDIIDPHGPQESDGSIFSPNYRSPERILNGRRPVYYDSLEMDDAKDAYERSRVVLSKIRQDDEDSWRKIWAHRVNSIGKLLEAKQIFAGVEVDVEFDGDGFLVNHPPMEPTGLVLEQWLEATEDKPDLQFWLDWKNPDPAMFQKALDRLEYLDRQFNIRHRSVVETASHAVFPELAELSLRGWRHAYYLPHEEMRRCISVESASDCDRTTASILASVGQIGATAVSYNFDLQEFTERYRATFGDLEFLTWHLDVADEYLLTEEFRKELETHAVLLVPFHTYYDR
jgi:heptose-I-phosphate ethanolaminephosphotransferase